MNPTLPFTPGALDPDTLALPAAPSIAGNDHSNASAETCAGGSGLPSMVCCW
jgi:hypothetical protein